MQVNIVQPTVLVVTSLRIRGTDWLICWRKFRAAGWCSEMQLVLLATPPFCKLRLVCTTQLGGRNNENKHNRASADFSTEILLKSSAGFFS